MSRAFELSLIRLAVDVLAVAADRAQRGAVGTIEVRLALRVLWTFLPDRHLLELFWEEVSRGGNPWNHGKLRLTGIVETLTATGWEVEPGSLPCEGWPMCNRYRMNESRAALAARYGVVSPYPLDLTVPPPELFPKRPAYVVRSIGGAPEIEVMNWGWPRTLPGKRGTPIQTQVTNVRNLDSPFWRSALRDPGKRCLVPVTSFSEYGDGPKGAKPLYWFDVPSEPVFSFAGIFRPEGDRYIFAFLTCEPNAIVAPIHPKAMPLILHREDEARWLAGEIDDLVFPFPSQLMTAREAVEPKSPAQNDPTQPNTPPASDATLIADRAKTST